MYAIIITSKADKKFGPNDQWVDKVYRANDPKILTDLADKLDPGAKESIHLIEPKIEKVQNPLGLRIYKYREYKVSNYYGGEILFTSMEEAEQFVQHITNVELLPK